MRTRIIMGIAYCLQHMHHDLNPPVVHPNLRSDSVFLTDDYAAKVNCFVLSQQRPLSLSPPPACLLNS